MDTQVRHRKSWTNEDNAFLFSNFAFLSSDEIATRMGRTRKAVVERVRHLKELGQWPDAAKDAISAEAVEFVDEETLVWFVRRLSSDELVITIDGLGNFRKR